MCLCAHRAVCLSVSTNVSPLLLIIPHHSCLKLACIAARRLYSHLAALRRVRWRAAQPALSLARQLLCFSREGIEAWKGKAASWAARSTDGACHRCCCCAPGWRDAAARVLPASTHQPHLSARPHTPAGRRRGWTTWMRRPPAVARRIAAAGTTRPCPQRRASRSCSFGSASRRRWTRQVCACVGCHRPQQQ